MNTRLAAICSLVLSVGACSFGSRGDTDSTPASASVQAVVPAPVFVVSAATAASTASAAPTAAPVPAIAANTLTDYSQEGLGALPDSCKAPAIVMMAVPKGYYDSDSFDWRHVRQVALANPSFSIVRKLVGAEGRKIAFSENEHKPTGGIALVAHCSTSKTCLRFAAAYRTVVPTAKLTLVCGANPNIGARLTGGKSVLPESGGIESILPDKKDTQSQCVRLAACKAARDFQLTGDETQQCMMKPGTFKLHCALKKTCDKVLACSDA